MGEMITIESGSDGGDGLAAYLAPAQGDVRGGLVVIHEIWGLVEHITEVADRFAAQGYQVIAPDLLSEAGITPEVGAELLRLRASDDQEEQTRVQPMMREKLAPMRAPEYGGWAVSALGRVLDRVAGLPGVGDRLAVTGFCFGGTYSFALAAADPRVKVAVPFYGAPPEESDVAAIRCPVLAFYGDQDERLMETLPQVKERMSGAGVDFDAVVYPGVGHAFFNDSNPHSYDEHSAQDAWQKTLHALQDALA